MAGIQGGHAHRFRDTFAVEFLLQGVDLRDVSILLGHSSTKVTEKHYAPWVKARQERLEAAVRSTWSVDYTGASIPQRRSRTAILGRDSQEPSQSNREEPWNPSRLKRPGVGCSVP